ncbi:serine/threonine-protein kinase [Kribbella sp. NPDC023855]|uniref:serine/threonine-protein kinase n=1 Tax=Kribbella sp. NPDC023855 TaxID=3154698 RepID=UPI0033FDC7B3
MLVANRYRLGPSIARGGMGEVFRATDEQLGREVAVKLLLPSVDEHAGERFHREAQAAARLSDPHVVSVYDFGPHGDGFFLVMELVEGGTVATELVQHGPLPKDRAIRIVEQAAAGLTAAHRENVVHRDVKPGNLLLAADGTVKVADFGIAHLPADGANTLTATGQIIGSALYLAPERASGGPAVMASDVYSLGCVLYQLVTGHPPFMAEHPAAILYQHVDAAPEPPSLHRPELAGAFESVLLRMLAKNPADRPSAAEIAAGSLRAESPGVVPVVPPGIAPAVAPAGAAAVLAGEGATSALEPVAAVPVDRTAGDRARNKALAAGVVALLATAAAVLAVVLLNGREPNLPPTTEIDPPAGATSSTPNRGATTTAPSTDPTQPTTGRSNSTTSAPPSRSASSQPTTPSTTPSPTSPSTTAPSSAPTTPSSRPTQSSSTPSGPTSAPSSTARPPSSTPSQSAGPTTPATGTPATGAPVSGAPVTGTPLTGGTTSATGSPTTSAAID